MTKDGRRSSIFLNVSTYIVCITDETNLRSKSLLSAFCDGYRSGV